MDPTTLVTFLFKAPPEAHTVELLGSWDNFQQPYYMHHDRRRGKGLWSGCFKFHNIIFDGDSSHWTKPRAGGLKQGGTYWYFYRLNDEVEAYDDSQSYTTSCPLLPGQRLNVIEVPTEIQDPPSRCRSASGNTLDELASASSTQTLEPSDKFAALNPPPVSKVHGRCISDLALGGRLETRPHSIKEIVPSPPASPRSHYDVPTSQNGPPQERFYPNWSYNHHPGSRSSLSSFFSGAPSITHSSILDVYCEEHFDLSPVLEAHSPLSGSIRSVLYGEDVPAEFATTDPFIDFDAQHGFHDDDFDGQHGDDDDDFDSLFQFPTSGPTYDQARPTTSHGRAQARHTRIYSLPNNAFQQLSTNSTQSSTPPRLSAERQHTSYSEPTAEAGPYDILSPTFSAATLSSVGLSTPFHLSVGCSRNASVRAPYSAEGEAGPEVSVEDVVERLRNLQSSYSAEAGVPSPRLYEREAGMFSGYSLPTPLERGFGKEQRDVSQMVQTSILGTGVGLMQELSLPPLVQDDDVGGESFADDIFSELGLLS